jgi:hypothetical protein
MNGLIREQLLEEHFAFGPAEHLRTGAGGGKRDFGAGGIIYRISALGIELFCTAHAIRGHPPSRFVDPEIDFQFETSIPTTGGGLLDALPAYVDPAE